MAEELSCTTPDELDKTTENTLNHVLPRKSQKLYEKEYEKFEYWCNQNGGVVNISENIVFAYFEKESKVMKSSSLWSKYSMIKACLNTYKNIDISKFCKLTAFLKQLSEGYQAKKSKILEMEQIQRFMNEADDKLYLVYKVILIMGYSGACRREEIINISLNDIQFKDDVVVVTISKKKTHIQKQFIITDKLWINLINKYRSLRPSHASHERFFLTYRNGKCVNSPIGINTIGKVPKIIATFLKLENPELFTGNCFRVSSMSNLGNSGSELITIKRHGRLKSSAVAEGYINSTSIKREVETEDILPDTSSTPSTFSHNGSSLITCTITKQNIEQQIQQFVSTQNLPGISINAHDRSTITVNVYNNCTITPPK